MSNAQPGIAPAPDELFEQQMAALDGPYYTREAKAIAAGQEPCTHCGRGVAPGKGFVTVVLAGGSRVAHPEAPEAQDTTDPGYMGEWVLGVSCARMIPSQARASRASRSR